MENKGILYLIPSPLSDSQTDFLLPDQKELIQSLKYFIVETPKTARAHLKKLGLLTPIFELDIQSYDDNTPKSQMPELLKPLFDGKDVGYMSDAGLPAVADPGSELVYLAHRNGVEVRPLIGASSLMLALMASGLNGQRFAFKGYLPIQQDQKIKSIKDLERLAFNYNETQLFIETPYRTEYMLRDLINTCNEKTLLTVAVDLTSPSQKILTQTIGEWRQTKLELNKHQVIFLIGKGKA
ncbi:MAG: SAM-dependent methyltransferase [Candidatus Dojkabacteria bacterium]